MVVTKGVSSDESEVCGSNSCPCPPSSPASKKIGKQFQPLKMNVDSILSYKKDACEDFYALLGCDDSASAEQVTAEFKVRVKACHPDKNTSDPESKHRFQLLLRVRKRNDDQTLLLTLLSFIRQKRPYVILKSEKSTMIGVVRALP